MRVVVETDGVETLVKTYRFLDTPVVDFLLKSPGFSQVPALFSLK